MGIFTDDFETSTKNVEIVTDRYNDSIKIIVNGKTINVESDDDYDRPIGGLHG